MTDWLDWPFFEDRHRELALRLTRTEVKDSHDRPVDEACRNLVRQFGQAGVLQLCTEGDVRSLAIARVSVSVNQPRFFLNLRRLKNSFRCAFVVAIFTRRQLRRTYS